MIMQWTTSGATPTGVPSSSTGVLGESRHNRGGDGLSTPGAARPKSRPRTTSSPDENADANQEQLTPTQGGGKARVDTFAGVDESDEEGEAAEGEASLPAAAALAGRVVTCAWLAEGCMLGMLEGQADGALRRLLDRDAARRGGGGRPEGIGSARAARVQDDPTPHRRRRLAVGHVGR